jgi:tRNA (mo5U34)-methyltransferase
MIDHVELGALSPEQLREASKDYYWYHSVDLGQGVTAKGDYDMNEYLAHYHFPANMSGMKVLDVGRASGFFSFEFERRGADVTATEIKSFLDWDFVGGDEERKRRAAEIGDVDAFTRKHITGAFNLAHAVRKSKVLCKTVKAYDISIDTIGGPFDLIFAGSLTSHLRDPILAFERFRSVIRPEGVCVLASPYIGIHEEMPLMALVGAADSDRRSWWLLNKRCLSEMLHCAGFSRVQIVDSFILRLRRTGDEHPHIVAHAMI